MNTQSTTRASQAAVPLAEPPIRSRIECRDQMLQLEQGLMLASGQWLKPARMAWRWTRPTDQPDAPSLIVLGGISAHRRVHGQGGPDRGWWDDLFANPSLSPERWQILSIDYLGGPGESSGARPVAEAHGHCRTVSTADQALAVKCVLDHLGIARVHAVIGASYGGLVGQQFARRFASRLDRLILLGAADQPDRMATALRHVQRELVRFGVRTHHADDGLALARALAVCSYRSAREFNRRFEHSATLANYLQHQGQRFVERFDAASFLCLSESIDAHRCCASTIDVPTGLIGFTGDQIAPVAQLRRLADALPDCLGLGIIRTRYGHDGFLKETDAVASLLATWLSDEPAAVTEAVQ